MALVSHQTATGSMVGGPSIYAAPAGSGVGLTKEPKRGTTLASKSVAPKLLNPYRSLQVLL